MPEAKSDGIFVSYRRQDSSHLAGRLYDRLADRFGPGRVFMDVDTIEPGVDYAEEINRALTGCAVLLAVIGPIWLTVTDERGRRRLDDPDDFVRLEVQAALARDMRVIPILTEQAVMPDPENLPGSLAALTRRNAFVIRHESFRSDAERLVAAIERVLAVPAPATAPIASDAAAVSPARNPVVAAVKPADAARKDRARAARVLGQALQIAYRYADESRREHDVPRFASIAKAMTATDPDRALRLITDTEAMARSISFNFGKAQALAVVAQALAPSDPARAARLAVEAEQIAQSVTDELMKAWTLANVVEAMAPIDPLRAEQLAQSVPDRFDHRCRALAAVAKAVALTDPGWAESIARSIRWESYEASALTVVAETMASIDPDHTDQLLADAERVADSIPYQPDRARELAAAAKVAAATDRRRGARLAAAAERIGSSITSEGEKARAFGYVATAIAPVDRRRAVRLARAAERIAESIPAESIEEKFGKAKVLAVAAKAMAVIDLDRAERIAQSMIDSAEKISVLVTIAEASQPGPPPVAGVTAT